MKDIAYHLCKILTISLFIASCSPQRPGVDVSGSDLEISIHRFEVDLFQNSAHELTGGDIRRLRNSYGTFYRLFTEGIIYVGRYNDSVTSYYLNHFKTDASVGEIADVTLKRWPDVNDLEHDFTMAFRRYSVLFPERLIPEIYTFVSAFSYTIVVDDSLIGIGLDMFLSNENDYYTRLGIPAYKIRTMRPPYIVPDCMKAWLSTEFEKDEPESDLLSYMIYHGKLLYALDLLLPDMEDSLKIGYTGAQMDWLRENEKEMWFHFAENELFFIKDDKQINKYIGEAPFTPGFPEGSPGSAGRWIGWQIVRRFMNNMNPLDLKTLFNEIDSQKILRLSKYKPD